MFGYGNRDSSMFHDTDDYNDLSAFVWNERFDRDRYDASFDSFASDESYDEYSENPDFDEAAFEDYPEEADWDDGNEEGWEGYEDDGFDGNAEDDIEEFYEDDEMSSHHYNRRQSRKKGLMPTFIAGAILVALLLGAIGAFLFMFVPHESANYISSNSPVPIAWIKAYKTQQARPQIYVQLTYRTAGGAQQRICGHVDAEKFTMYGEWTEFAGFGVTSSAKGFRWLETDGQFSAAECLSEGQTAGSQQNSTSLNGNEDGLYQFVTRTPVISGLVGTVSRSVFVGPITSTTTQNYVVYLSPNGTVSCDLVK